MKKIVLIISLILLSGCATNELNMTIDYSGNVYLNHTLDLEDNIELLQDFNVNTKTFNYKVDNNIHTITKSLGKIRDIDLNKDEIISLDNYLDEDFEFNKMFDCTSLFFVSKCYAKYQIDLENIGNLNSIIENTEDEYDNSNDEYIIDTLNNSIINKFTLNSKLPIGENNSDSYEDGIYTWNLSFGKINYINFVVYNYNLDRIVALIAFIIIFIIIKSISNKSKKAENINNMDIMKSLKNDTSIKTSNEKEIVKKDNKKDIKNINDRIRKI